MKEKTSIFKDSFYVLKLIHKSSPQRIPTYFLSIILGVASNFLFNIYLLRLVLNGLQNGVPFSEIVIYVVCIGILLIAYYVFNNYYNEIFIPKSNQIIYKSIQKQVYAKARQVDLACYEDPKFYKEYMRAVSETNGIAQAVLSSLGGWVSSILTICSVSLMIFMIDPIFIIFAAIPVAYSLLFGKKLVDLRYNLSMEMTEKSRERDYIKRTFYLSDYAKEMRLTGISNVLLGRFFKAVKELKYIIRKQGLKIAVLDYFSIVIQHVILFVGTIIYSTYRTVVLKNMLFGDCVIVINNIVSTSGAINGLVDGYLTMHRNSLSVKNIRTFLEYEPKIKDEPDSWDVPDIMPYIELKSVSFSYDGEKNVLNNVDLRIKPGEKIALVGHNGAGKTTLVKLLLRFYDPDSGAVNLNGSDVKKYKVSQYRKLFATVFQNYKVFSMSALKNVLLKGNITDKEHDKAIIGMQNSGIYDKIMSLPDKENTVLTREFDENGTVFSGGENQKIAISRIFTKPCKIVIMDEPSSALDPIAEYKMYEAMMKACENKSVVYISHRLSSAVLADRIYLLENGSVVETGTHSELLSLNGKYADMWAKQSEQYKKGVAKDA